MSALPDIQDAVRPDPSASLRRPFRADHVGSILRPPELHKARKDFADGRLDAEGLRTAEDEAVVKAVRMQEEVGLLAITDGEYRRATWHMDYLYAIGGVEKVKQNLEVAFHNAQGDIRWTPSGLHIIDKLSLKKVIFGEDFRFLKSVVKRGVPKLTIPSPSMMHYRGGNAAIDKAAYPDIEGFWSDLAKVYRDEIAGLDKLGCTYLQLDDTSLAYLNDPAQRAHVDQIGGHGEDQHLTYIRVMNDALKDRPAGMTVCTHLCRGNFRSSWVASGSYDHVADALFNQLDVDGYFLEFDDDRSGGFEPLRFLPKGHKRIVLGLVTTKHAALETKELLLRRIEQASKYAPLDQLCLSPQCGFSSTVEGNDLSWQQQIDKLALVVETAREVWGDAA
ncbi:MAG: 5-methyltetrahydropteroyltriglutamate--homocysteine S-methyltransferase [Caulobacteraceae bacterium]